MKLYNLMFPLLLFQIEETHILKSMTEYIRPANFQLTIKRVMEEKVCFLFLFGQSFLALQSHALLTNFL